MLRRKRIRSGLNHSGAQAPRLEVEVCAGVNNAELVGAAVLYAGSSRCYTSRSARYNTFQSAGVRCAQRLACQRRKRWCSIRSTVNV